MGHLTGTTPARAGQRRSRRRHRRGIADASAGTLEGRVKLRRRSARHMPNTAARPRGRPVSMAVPLRRAKRLACGEPHATSPAHTPETRGARATALVAQATQPANSNGGAASPVRPDAARGGTGTPTQQTGRDQGSSATAWALRPSPAKQRCAVMQRSAAQPGSRSRYIPVTVKREVWRRDQGCCSYVDRHSGRRCGSRYRLEIDHIVPYALGGGADLSNLRI